MTSGLINLLLVVHEPWRRGSGSSAWSSCSTAQCRRLSIHRITSDTYTWPSFIPQWFCFGWRSLTSSLVYSNVSLDIMTLSFIVGDLNIHLNGEDDCHDPTNCSRNSTNYSQPKLGFVFTTNLIMMIKVTPSGAVALCIKESVTYMSLMPICCRLIQACTFYHYILYVNNCPVTTLIDSSAQVPIMSCNIYLP